MDLKPTHHTIDIDGLRLHYRELAPEPNPAADAEPAEPVLLLHGWPTSSFLWRDVMTAMGSGTRVIALDLPGFGQSDKPLDVSYSFRYYRRVLDQFTAALGIDKLGLVVHDLGGPVGLYWACQHPGRITKLALLNTAFYPEMSWAVMAFVLACRLPGARHLLSSPHGLHMAMVIGVADRKRLGSGVVAAVQAPFATRDARRALVKAGTGLSPKGLKEIAHKLPKFEGPVRIIYGQRDRILPDVAETMNRVKRDLPQAEITVLPDCGHFLQEERPGDIGRMLGEFFASSPA